MLVCRGVSDRISQAITGALICKIPYLFPVLNNLSSNPDAPSWPPGIFGNRKLTSQSGTLLSRHQRLFFIAALILTVYSTGDLELDPYP